MRSVAILCVFIAFCQAEYLSTITYFDEVCQKAYFAEYYPMDLCINFNQSTSLSWKYVKTGNNSYPYQKKYYDEKNCQGKETDGLLTPQQLGCFEIPSDSGEKISYGSNFVSVVSITGWVFKETLYNENNTEFPYLIRMYYPGCYDGYEYKIVDNNVIRYSYESLNCTGEKQVVYNLTCTNNKRVEWEGFNAYRIVTCGAHHFVMMVALLLFILI